MMTLRASQIHAGKLNRFVSFQRRLPASDGAGGRTERWVSIQNAPSYAYIMPFTGAERYASDRVEATFRYQVVVRYTDKLRESDRMIFRGKAYNIRLLQNMDLMDKWLLIHVDGGVAV